MTNKQLSAMRADPALFVEAVAAARGHALAPFQVERFGQLAPSLLAVIGGERPPIGKFFFEAIKGGSKTTDLSIVVLYVLAFSPRALLIQVGASDADQAGELLKAAAEVMRDVPWLSDRVTIQASRIVCPGSASVCDILAADTAGSHGARPDVLILDEVVHVAKTEFLENLLDNASKKPNALVIVATNAGVIASWAWKLRELARGSTRWFFHQQTEPSPWVDTAEIEEARQRNTPSRFARLWGGVWASGSGDALDPSDVEAAINQDGPMVGADAEYTMVGGLDLGIKHDHSALVVIGVHRQTRRRQLAFCRSWAPAKGKVNLEEVREGIKEAHKTYRLSALNYDPWQAELLATELRRESALRMVEYPFTGKNCNEMASELLEVFTSRAIDLYRHPPLLRDLGRIVLLEKSYGYKIESFRDADGHSDLAQALALAIVAAKHANHGKFECMVYNLGPDTPKYPTRPAGFGLGMLSNWMKDKQQEAVVHGGVRPTFVTDNAARHGDVPPAADDKGTPGWS